MKTRVIFLILSLTIIFGTIFLSRLIFVDNTPMVPVKIDLPSNILEELNYVSLGTIGGDENYCDLQAVNLPHGTEIYRFVRNQLPFNAFTLIDGEFQLYLMLFDGIKQLNTGPTLTLLRMAEREEYADISHYLIAMHRTFSRLENDRFYGFHFEVPDEIKPKLRKAIAELSEIYDFEYKEGELSDFITAHEGFSWEFKEEYDKMMWIYISSADRVFSGNMEITVGKVTGSLGSIDITYLVEKIDGKWTVTRELSVGQS